MHNRGDSSLSRSPEQLSSASPSRDSDNLHRRLHGLPTMQKKLKELAKNEGSQLTRENEKASIGDRLLNDITLQDIHTRMQQMDCGLIIVSNRGAKEYKLEGQQFKEKLGAGGLSTALANIKDYGIPVKWYSAPMGQGDRDAITEGLPNNYVDMDSTIYNEYYNKSSNGVLWPLLHEMTYNIELDVLQRHEMSWKSYTYANQAFADTVNAQIKREQNIKPMVMIQDYHLLLVPGMLRKRNPDMLLQHFIHTPWPKHEAWKVLHKDIVNDIYTGLLNNDIIGFQTNNDAENFLQGVKDQLPNAIVNVQEQTVRWQGRDTQVCVYPISVSIADVREKANSDSSKQNANNEKKKEIETLQSLLKKEYKFIMRGGRIDPTKNIETGFKAYDEMLDKYPDMRGKVSFLAFLVPSRENVQIYRQLQDRVMSLVKTINGKHGKEGWQPISLFIGHDQETVLNALKFYDVLLVNPIKDGMNLVVKEGAAVNQKDGVIVLSKGAGAFDQLKDGVIPISSPDDVKETAETLYKAIHISPQERKAKAEIARKIVENYDLKRWLLEQLRDMLLRKGQKETSPEDDIVLIPETNQPTAYD